MKKHSPAIFVNRGAFLYDFKDSSACHTCAASPAGTPSCDISIRALRHLALQSSNKWDCEVTAFPSSDAKETWKLGAHSVVDSHDDSQLKQVAGLP